jgi:hypothetical protein
VELVGKELGMFVERHLPTNRDGNVASFSAPLEPVV